MLIDRPTPANRIREALAVHPCAALTGPRQCGKTTLARQIAAESPGTTRSMRVALQDLQLDHLWIVYPGDEEYVLDDRISVLPVAQIGTLAAAMTSKGW